MRFRAFETIWIWLKGALAKRTVRWVLFVVFAGFFMFVGGLVYASFLVASELGILAALGVLSSALLAIVTGGLVIAEKIFQIELSDRRLRLAENDTVISVEKQQEMGRRIVAGILPLIAHEVDVRDTVYETRSTHYKEEKIALAEMVLSTLGFAGKSSVRATGY